MQFKNETGVWSTAETYATTKSWTLTAGDGTKTVYVKYKDNAGNWTVTNITDTITVDTTAPTGTVNINSSAALTTTTTVTLALSANDGAGSGVNRMQFSNDGTTWSTIQAYGVTKIWSLTGTDSVKTVYVRYMDAAGNTGDVTDAIKLCTVNNLVVEAPQDATANSTINITIRAYRDTTPITGYLNKVTFTLTDPNAVKPADYTFVSGDNGVKIIPVTLKTLGKQKLEITDTEISGLKKSVEIRVYEAAIVDGSTGKILTNPDGTTIEIPAGAFSGNRMIGVRISENPASEAIGVKQGIRYKATLKSITRDFGEIDTSVTPWVLKKISFDKSVTVSIPYQPGDIGEMDENCLRVYYYDETAGRYTIVQGTQSVSGGKVTAKVDHFSTYRVFGTYLSSNLNNVIAYPNPYKPATAVGGNLKIINLPADCTATIYNMAGEKIRTMNESDTGNLGWIEWDGKNESGEIISFGVYVYLIKAPDGSRKTGKIGLTR